MSKKQISKYSLDLKNIKNIFKQFLSDQKLGSKLVQESISKERQRDINSCNQLRHEMKLQRIK